MSYCYPDRVNVVLAEPDKITVIVDKDFSGRTVRTYIYHGWPVYITTLDEHGFVNYQDYPSQTVHGPLSAAARRAGLEFEAEIEGLAWTEDLDSERIEVGRLTDEEVQEVWHNMVFEGKHLGLSQGYGFCELDEAVGVKSHPGYKEEEPNVNE